MPKKTKPAQREELDPAYGSSSRGEGRTPQIRHTHPEVAKHCARMIIAANMDYEAAVGKMWEAEFPDATDEQIIAKAEVLARSTHIQKEIGAQLEKIGFGDKAQTKLIAMLWKEVLGTNDKRWVGAARLLAEITQAAKAKSKGEKIPVLKFAGMDEGIKAMLGDAAPTDDYSTIKLEDEDDAADDDSTGFKSDGE